jgi:hypothetical protein
MKRQVTQRRCWCVNQSWLVKEAGPQRKSWGMNQSWIVLKKQVTQRRCWSMNQSWLVKKRQAPEEVLGREPELVRQ